MITYSVIRDIKYYTDSSRKPDTRLGYYADACGEPPGVWWSPGNFQGVDGSAVEPVALERLASYRDTKTGRTLPGQRAADARAGTDFTFSAPKAFSALWAMSDERNRAKLEKMFLDSVRASLTQLRHFDPCGREKVAEFRGFFRVRLNCGAKLFGFSELDCLF